MSRYAAAFLLIGFYSGLSWAAEPVQDGVCQALKIESPVHPDEGRGFLVLDVELKAYLPFENEIYAVEVTLAGPGKSALTRSAVQCGKLVVFPNLTPGEYQIHSIQGRLDTSMARIRFFYPDHDEGYRVPNPQIGNGSSNLYRMPVPKSEPGKVRVNAGTGAYLGQLKVKRKPYSTWGVEPYWEKSAAREQQTWAFFRQLYPEIPLESTIE